MEKFIEKVPTWALCCIINGDITNLEKGEKEMIEGWLNESHYQIISPICDEEGNAHPYFTHYPAFGLPCEVEDCECVVF